VPVVVPAAAAAAAPEAAMPEWRTEEQREAHQDTFLAKPGQIVGGIAWTPPLRQVLVCEPETKSTCLRLLARRWKNGIEMVYVVTFAAVLNPEVQQEAGVPLRDLEALTRVHIRDAVLDAVANPERAGPHTVGGRPRTTPLTAVKMVVFMEKHANGSKHFHVAVKLSSNTRWLCLKLALRRRSGLASHWSASHSMFWSAVRYGTFATQTKREVDSTPLAWTADGSHLNLHEESQEPFNAKALKARREKREREESDAVLAGKKKVGEGRQMSHAVFGV